MTDAERYKLLHGPYVAPQCRRGDVLTCEARGRDVTVGGMSDGRIPWPRLLKNGRPCLILCGDLVRAVRTESEQAVAYWWGVSITVVWSWRKALGVSRVNDGTARLYRDYQPDKLPADVTAAAREAARSPESLAKMSKARRGKPAPPNTREALLNAAKSPKPEGFGRRANAWMADGRRRKRDQDKDTT